MKSHYTTNSRYITHTIAFWKVGRIHFLSSGVKGLMQKYGHILLLVYALEMFIWLNPFTPKSDQVRISPVASPVILHHTVWRTWLFIAYSDWKMILVPVLTTSLIQFSWKGWENVHIGFAPNVCDMINTVISTGIWKLGYQNAAIMETKTPYSQ